MIIYYQKKKNKKTKTKVYPFTKDEKNSIRSINFIDSTDYAIFSTLTTFLTVEIERFHPFFQPFESIFLFIIVIIGFYQNLVFF